MPVYLYWGEDDFAIAQAATALRQRVLDPDWSSFNYDKLSAEQPDAIVQGLNQAMTPPFGAGSRLVWLADTTLCQRCSEELLAELQRTLPAIPDTSVLLLTASAKPDGRLKSTKLLQTHAEIREFPQIPPWKTDLLVQQVRQAAQALGVKLKPAAATLLAEAVGSNTRQLYSELEKLRVYVGESTHPIDEATIAALVTASSQNALQLATAIRQGQTGRALELVADLLQRNEPALAIVKTLVGQFRTWIWVKLMLETGERDEQAIAQAAELRNPKQLYFLRKDLDHLTLNTLMQALPLLLELEFNLKCGAEELPTLQTKVIELCECCR